MSSAKEGIIKMIIDNYRNMESSIAHQLSFKCQHSTTIGGYREEIWKSLFEQIVPKKFTVERSVFIIDSSGEVSNEVDLAIFDEQYTPYIFNYGKMKFIPIEAVAVVVQCKSTQIPKEDIEEWVESIDKLQTSFQSIARMHNYIVINKQEDCIANKSEYDKLYNSDENSKKKSKPTQTSTRPIKILCHISSNWSDKHQLKKYFDFIISLKQRGITKNKEGDHELGLKIETHPEKGYLAYWYKSLNHKHTYFGNENYTDINEENLKIELDNFRIIKKNNDKEVGEASILTLIFQLNQLLMLINNPLLFPHQAYVKMFNDNLE